MSRQSKKRKVVEMPETYPIWVYLGRGRSQTFLIHSPDAAYYHLERLFEGNRPALLQAAWKLVKDFQQAEDVVQATLIGLYYALNNGKLYVLELDDETLFVKGGQLPPSAREKHDRRLIEHWLSGGESSEMIIVENPFAWVRKSLTNNAYQRLKKEKWYREFCVNSKNWELAEDPKYPNPEHILPEEERRAEIRALVATLPSRYGEIVELRFFEERRFAEIAQILGRPVKTVMKQSTRALAMIADIMHGRRVIKDGRWVLAQKPAQ